MKEQYIETQVSRTLIKLLQTNTLKEITIKELCNDAQVGRASFYRYYTSLEDVLNKKALFLIKSWGYEFEQNPKSTPDMVFESLFNHFKDNKDFYSVLYKCGQTQVIIDTIKTKLELYNNIPNSTAYGKSYFAYGIFGWINEWIMRGMQEEPETLNHLFFEQTQIISNTIKLLNPSITL